MEDNKTKLETFQFDSVYPDPTYTTNRGKNWINFGVDNLLPVYLNKLIDMSAVHSSILNGTIQLVNGDGFSEPTDPMLKAIYDNVNTEDDFTFYENNLNSVLVNLSKDQQTYGAFALNIRWSKDRTKIADYSAINVAKLRIDSEGNGYWYCEDWTNPKKYVPEFFHSFSSDVKIKKEFPSQIIYIINTGNRDNKYYALPRYWSSRSMIECDFELDSYNLNRLRNSFMANAIIKYDGYPEKEQRDILYNQLKKFYSGTKNSSKTLVLYDQKVTIDKFEGNTTPRDYSEIQKTVYQKIMTSWGVVGKGGLFGLNISEGGVDFSTDSLLNEYEVYAKTVVRPSQSQIERVFNQIAKINGYSGDELLQIIPLKLFENKQSIESNLDQDNNIVEGVKVTDQLMDKIKDNL